MDAHVLSRLQTRQDPAKHAAKSRRIVEYLRLPRIPSYVSRVPPTALGLTSERAHPSGISGWPPAGFCTRLKSTSPLVYLG